MSVAKIRKVIQAYKDFLLTQKPEAPLTTSMAQTSSSSMHMPQGLSAFSNTQSADEREIALAEVEGGKAQPTLFDKDSEEESEASEKTSEIDEERLEFIDTQLDMLDSCYDQNSQCMRIQEHTGYVESYTDIRDPSLYQLEKFIQRIAMVSKKNVSSLRISVGYPNKNHLWDFIENNQDLLEMHIFGNFVDGAFIENDIFYSVFNTSKSLFYIDIYDPDHDYDLDIETIKEKLLNKIDPNRNLIISWGSLGSRTTLVKTARKHEVFCISNVSDIIDEIDSSEDDEGTVTESDEDTSQNSDSESQTIAATTPEIIVNSTGSYNIYYDDVFLSTLMNKALFGLPLIFCRLVAKQTNKIIDFPARYIDSLSKIDFFDININTDEDLGGWRLIDYAIFHNDILTTRYIMSCGVNMNRGVNLKKINESGERALELAAVHAGIEVIQALLGINVSSPNTLDEDYRDLLYLENTNKLTPVMIAAKEGRLDVLKFLIDIDAISELSDAMKAKMIQLAWDNQHYTCVHLLLSMDFPFPVNFIIPTPPADGAEQLDMLANARRTFHRLIRTNNLNAIKAFLDQVPQRGLAINMRNKSAIFIALTRGHYHIYAYLKSLGFKSMPDEAVDCEIGILSALEKSKLNKALVTYFNKSSQSSVFYLLSKTRVLQNEGRYFDTIKFMYEQLCHIPEIALLLSVIEHYQGPVDIVFDFNSSNTLDLDVTSSQSTKGQYQYESGRILVAAKREHQELLGSLAHELAHFVMQILYKNLCKPYVEGHDEAARYQVIVSSYSQSNPNIFDKIIQLAFSVYTQADWAAELIVRVPHILACYGRVEGITKLQAQANELFVYYREVILPACRQYIKTNPSVHVDGKIVASYLSHHNPDEENPYAFWHNAQASTSNAVITCPTKTL